MEEMLREIVADQLGISQADIKLDTKFEDVGADSLDLVEIVMAVEEEYSLVIEDEEAEKITTFGELVEYVKVHTNIN